MIQEAGQDSNRIVFTKFLFFFTGSLLIGALITIYVLLNIAGSNDRMALAKLEEIKRDLEKEQKELKVNIEFVSSPERIESMAVNRFKMIPVTGEHVYLVRMRPTGQPAKTGR